MSDAGCFGRKIRLCVEIARLHSVTLEMTGIGERHPWPKQSAAEGSCIAKQDSAKRRGFSTRSPKEFFEPASLAQNDGHFVLINCTCSPA